MSRDFLFYPKKTNEIRVESQDDLLGAAPANGGKGSHDITVLAVLRSVWVRASLLGYVGIVSQNGPKVNMARIGCG
jgi:hypothetical protein